MLKSKDSKAPVFDAYYQFLLEISSLTHSFNSPDILTTLPPRKEVTEELQHDDHPAPLDLAFQIGIYQRAGARCLPFQHETSD